MPHASVEPEQDPPERRPDVHARHFRVRVAVALGQLPQIGVAELILSSAEHPAEQQARHEQRDDAQRGLGPAARGSQLDHRFSLTLRQPWQTTSMLFPSGSKTNAA